MKKQSNGIKNVTWQFAKKIMVRQKKSFTFLGTSISNYYTVIGT